MSSFTPINLSSTVFLLYVYLLYISQLTNKNFIKTVEHLNHFKAIQVEICQGFQKRYLKLFHLHAESVNRVNILQQYPTLWLCSLLKQNFMRWTSNPGKSSTHTHTQHAYKRMFRNSSVRTFTRTLAYLSMHTQSSSRVINVLRERGTHNKPTHSIPP